jgi:hypothetical protein
MNEHIHQYLSDIGKRGGKVSGGAKANASRNNGKLGGRPKKNHSKELGGNKAGKANSLIPAFTGNTQRTSKVAVQV